MPIRASRSDVLSHVHADLLAEAEAAAGGNGVLSKAEQAAMPDGLLKKAAGWVREDGGAGTRVDVDAMVGKATRRMATLLGRVNQRSGAGAETISQREVQALHANDSEAGLRVARAYELITGKHIDFTPAPVDSSDLTQLRDQLADLRRQAGGGVLAEDLLEQRGHAGRGGRTGG